MICFMIFCLLWFLQTENSTALIRFSVPEHHHVCLLCDASDTSHVIWTHGDGDVLVTEQDYDANEEQQRHLLLSDGGLCLLQLHDSDSGEYHCNEQPVAELQVLTGRDFSVSSGRTLLLPCGRSPKPKQRWFHRRRGGRREAIFTRFRNGTVKPEREDGRLGFMYDALQIQDLQPGDAGEYQCNGELLGRVTVLTEPTSVQTFITSTSAAVGTDVVESKTKKKTTQSALLMVAVVSSGLMILLMSVVFILLTSIKCRRKPRYTAQTLDDTELQPWTTNTPTEWEESESWSTTDDIHYASLGRHNWSERPSRTPPDQDQNHVIYSSVITRAAVKHTPVL
ncbi:uncharacterized protein LOC124855027 [Hippoglossus stenolepis]|uniref:uncharacterized protein LOC124855027 n=1 Tax=Hippoglossus stenolepis TaxID=195615 RepID=UPI001FAEB49E|nr:uncharacterized protein LOC124855027 [Hippoglossus stenolepis]